MNFFLNRYKELGQNIDPEECQLKTSIRVNTLKISDAQLVKRLKQRKITLSKIPWLDHGYYSESEFSAGSTQEYLQGFYYVQEAAAQVPAMILNPNKDDVVLDMCAAPGGKTCQLAQYMENKGTLIALDNNKPRLASLKNNLERLGITNTLIYNLDAKYINSLDMKFDKILLDAPCSGNFCTDRNWFGKRTIEGIKQKAKQQKDLLKAAVSALKPAGELVYSTCSLEPEENEEVIEWALETLGIELLPVELDVGSPGLTKKTVKCLRFWPNKDKTEGFFLAKIRL
jgi:tRNA (cytosine40_48-C5)-methyltransferase